MADDHALALQRFKLATEDGQAQRARELEDLAFQVPEKQWPDEVRQQRAAQVVQGVPIPARPMLSIPWLDQPIQLVLNQERAAHLGVQIHPLSEDANEETAEMLQGLYRKIEVDSRAGLARSWAFDRAVKCGRGAYRILTEYADDEGGHPSDQRIVIKRMLRQPYFDPFAEEPDWSDGEWGFIPAFLSVARFKRRFGTSKLAGYDDRSLQDMAKDFPEWIAGDDDTSRAILVLEYFRKIFSEGRARGNGDREDAVTVRWSTINAIEELDTPRDWGGKYIPIVPVIGRELQPFDRKRRWDGIIGPNKDSARLGNFSASAAVETVALEPKASFDIDPEEIEGYQEIWAMAPTRNFGYLPRHKWLHNQLLPPPIRHQADTSKLQMSMLLLQQAQQFLHTGTGAFEPTLGQSSPNAKTKGGTLALQDQHDRGTSNFLDNLVEISMTYESKVILDLIPHIYDRPGRITRILDLEDKPKLVMLNRPFVQSKPTARPTPIDHAGGPLPNGAKHFDLGKGRYAVTASVGKSYQSRVDQGSDQLGQIIQADPQLMMVLGPTWFKFLDFPGHLEAAELLKKMQPPQLQDQDGADAAQQVPQLKAQLQQQSQQLQQAVEFVKTEQAKHQAQVEIQKIQSSAQVEIQRMKDATAIEVARINASVKIGQSIHEASEEAIALHQQVVADAATQGRDHAHELAIGQQAAQQQAAQGDQETANQAALADQGHQHALEQGQQSGDQALAQQQAAAQAQPDAGAGA